jgi:CRISPR-associated RAMP protein, SSO1426 family
MNADWILHNKLYRSITLYVNYVNKSPLRIGAGKGRSLTSLVDLAVLRININGKELPYIPGSSLKGVFRSTTENIARSYNISNICYGGEEGSQREFRNELDDAIKNNDIERIKETLNRLCLCCKIFGSSSYASHIIFSDAYVNGDFMLGVKTGIAINRRSGSVKRGALYEVEYVNPGVSFNGEIILNNLPNYAIGLIAKVIDYINSGIVKIGGFKSRGFGEVECKINNISGKVNIGGSIKDLSEIDKLTKLDDNDKDIVIDKNNILGILDQAKVIFDEYASSNR